MFQRNARDSRHAGHPTSDCVLHPATWIQAGLVTKEDAIIALFKKFEKRVEEEAKALRQTSGAIYIPSIPRTNPAENTFWRTAFGAFALRLRALATLLLARERRRIACLKA